MICKIKKALIFILDNVIMPVAYLCVIIYWIAQAVYEDDKVDIIDSEIIN